MEILNLLAVGVVSLLIATPIIAYAKKRRLFVVVPRLFSHNNLAEKGQTVEMTVLNRGYRTEENIKITLDTKLTYELIASNVPDVNIDSGIIKIDRIPSNDDATIVLLCENGEFSEKSISRISSKEAKGVIVEKLDSVPPLFGNFVGALFTIFVLIVFLVGGGFVAGHFVFPPDKEENLDESEVNVIPHILESTGWSKIAEYVDSEIYPLGQPYKFPVSLEYLGREGDLVRVKFVIDNKSDSRIEFTGRLISSANDYKNISLSDYYVHNLLVFPNNPREVILKAYLPEDAEPQLLIADVTLKNEHDAIYNIQKDIILDQIENDN